MDSSKDVSSQAILKLQIESTFLPFFCSFSLQEKMHWKQAKPHLLDKGAHSSCNSSMGATSTVCLKASMLFKP